MHRLAYCTNVHAGATLAETKANLSTYASRVRTILDLERLGVGLWLSAHAAQELLATNGAPALRDHCDALNLDILTLNGFPYGNFHAKRVKHDVYLPRWDDPKRLAYTVDLAACLAALLPEGVTDASISTLPLGWRGDVDLDQAASNLRVCAQELRALEDASGVHLHVDLEPEPGCELDTAEGLAAFFDSFLPEEAHRAYLGVCHDICHSAVMFEPQTAALRTYREAGVRLGKIQVSSAIEVDVDHTENPADALRAYAAFAEERYLHQTMIVRANGTSFHDDLPDALAAEEASGIWRTHFHVPIFSLGIDGWSSTQADIARCLAAVPSSEPFPILEIETYAWDVLPSCLHETNGLASGIAEEWRWLARLVETIRPNEPTS